MGRNTPGGLAQLARASALQAEGQGFESLSLHRRKANRDERSSGRESQWSFTYIAKDRE